MNHHNNNRSFNSSDESLPELQESMEEDEYNEDNELNGFQPVHDDQYPYSAEEEDYGEWWTITLTKDHYLDMVIKKKQTLYCRQ